VHPAVSSVLLVFALSCEAAVFHYDRAGRQCLWDLVASPGGGLVGTNSVNPATRAIRYFLAADAYSATNTAAELNAVRAAFAVWQATTNSILKFEEGGTVSPPVDVNYLDRTNLVFWAKTSTLVQGGTADITGLAAEAFFATASGVIVGADIVLNGVNYGWFTDIEAVPAVSGYYCIEAILTHELGHFIGLEHSPLGGATLFYRDRGGVGPYLGLSTDERLAVQFLYPATGLLATRGRIEGTVALAGANVLGALVVAEDAAGNVASATLSRTNGAYSLPALFPGTYLVRASPLDPATANVFLTRGREIVNPDYASSITAFLPTANTAVTVAAGQTKTLNFALTGGTPAPRIIGIRPPSTDLVHAFPGNATAAMQVGQSNYYVGVWSQDSLVGATLSVTGDGVSLQPVGVSTPYFGYNLILVNASVSRNAAPGLRTFVLNRGTNVAYANGFFEVVPPYPDDNLDGLDDRFQRRYFPLWTAAVAGPKADPDADQFTNQYEHLADSDPTDAASRPTVALDDVTLSRTGTTISWPAVSGAQYQVWRRDRFGPADAWTTNLAGSRITATNTTAQFLDPSSTNRVRFYRVQILPGL
jgi:hypothetical protein